MRVIAGKYRSRRLQTYPAGTSSNGRSPARNIIQRAHSGKSGGPGGNGLGRSLCGDGCGWHRGHQPRRQHGSLRGIVRSAVRLISKNLAALGINAGFQILEQDSIRASGAQLYDTAADFVFLDPPYEMEEAYRQALENAFKIGSLKHESYVVAEHQKKFDPGEAFGSLRRYRKLVQGDAR